MQFMPHACTQNGILYLPCIDCKLQFPILSSLTHFKGHQDTKLNNLDLPAQMNVEPDLLATLALQNWGLPKLVVPFDPLSYAMLSIKGWAVTQNL